MTAGDKRYVCIRRLEEIGLYKVVSGAIIGDGDRKRAPFLVLGLAP